MCLAWFPISFRVFVSKSFMHRNHEWFGSFAGCIILHSMKMNSQTRSLFYFAILNDALINIPWGFDMCRVRFQKSRAHTTLDTWIRSASISCIIFSILWIYDSALFALNELKIACLTQTHKMAINSLSGGRKLGRHVQNCIGHFWCMSCCHFVFLSLACILSFSDKTHRIISAQNTCLCAFLFWCRG